MLASLPKGQGTATNIGDLSMKYIFECSSTLDLLNLRDSLLKLYPLASHSNFDTSQRIDVLKLSVRTINSLLGNDVTTVQQLLELGKNGFMTLPNVGRISFDEVYKKVTDLGLSFYEFPK